MTYIYGTTIRVAPIYRSLLKAISEKTGAASTEEAFKDAVAWRLIDIGHNPQHVDSNLKECMRTIADRTGRGLTAEAHFLLDKYALKVGLNPVRGIDSSGERWL